MGEPLTGREQTVSEQAAGLLLKMGVQRDFTPPTVDEDPRELHRILREDLRARLDAAEELLREITRVRHRARREAARLKAAADDEYDKKMSVLAERAVRLEYQSVHDRTAMARVHASPHVRAQREAERVADMVSEAEEVMKSMYFGLRDVRRELLATLEHFLPWDSSLER